MEAKTLKHRCFPVVFTKVLITEVYKPLLLKPVVSTWSVLFNKLHLCLKLVHGFCIKFTVLLASSSFITNTIDTATIRSNRLVVFCKKGVLTNFSKFTKNTCARALFLKKRQIYRVNLYQKRDSDTCFLVISAKFLITSF